MPGRGSGGLPSLYPPVLPSSSCRWPLPRGGEWDPSAAAGWGRAKIAASLCGPEAACNLVLSLSGSGGQPALCPPPGPGLERGDVLQGRGRRWPTAKECRPTLLRIVLPPLVTLGCPPTFPSPQGSLRKSPLPSQIPFSFLENLLSPKALTPPVTHHAHLLLLATSVGHWAGQGVLPLKPPPPPLPGPWTPVTYHGLLSRAPDPSVQLPSQGLHSTTLLLSHLGRVQRGSYLAQGHCQPNRGRGPTAKGTGPVLALGPHFLLEYSVRLLGPPSHHESPLFIFLIF